MLKHIDVVLVTATVAISALGLLMVYSSTRTKLAAAGIDPHYYLKKQALYMGLGLVVLLVTTLVDYHRLEEWGLALYGAVVLGLLAVMTPLGTNSGTAQAATRWFNLGSFQLQPSAFASIALIVAAAVYCSRHEGELHLSRVFILLFMTGVPILLVVKQPDLGTGIIMSVVLLVLLVAAGAKARHVAVLLLLAVAAMFMVVHLGMLKKYQIDRLTTFIHQGQHLSTAEARGNAYNLDQSIATIASGGPAGKGLFKGPQTNLAYVPFQSTDFIFTAVGEQLGFAGTASVLALFGLIIWRMLRAAQLARDHLGRLLCAGALGLIAFSVFQNAGMTMGIMPITGVPLPFMSYGGSATLAFFAAVGLVLNVGMRRLR